MNTFPKEYRIINAATKNVVMEFDYYPDAKNYVKATKAKWPKHHFSILDSQGRTV